MAHIFIQSCSRLMSSPPISIVGAGLSGLTLALALKRKGLASIIYDRATASPRYQYGITLYPSTINRLLSLLQLDEVAFKQEVAVDTQQGGQGALKASTPGSFRCHRGRLESLLGAGLTISWDKRLNDITLDAPAKKLLARFDDDFDLETAHLVGCDGPHSMARQSLVPSMKLKVLPYAVYNGKRRMSISEYQATLQGHMQDSVLIVTQKEGARFEIAINDFTPSEVSLSYIYSRPALSSGNQPDPLHSPDRPIAGATDIPEAFFEELSIAKDLQEPFASIFDPEKIREDRVLHWLMRDIRPHLQEIQAIAQKGVLFIGDSVHATPILGGDGANLAITDGIDLAEYIASHGIESWVDFYATKHDSWHRSVTASESEIQAMHVSRVPQL